MRLLDQISFIDTIKMKGALVLAVILAGLVAVQADWERNKVYKYEVKTKTLKYWSQSPSDPAGIYSRHHLILKPYSDEVIIGKITQAEFGKVKELRYEDDNRDNYESAEGNFENSALSKPFKINLKSGVIESLGVDGSLSTFEVNHLKLIMNPFQVVTNRQSGNSRESGNDRKGYSREYSQESSENQLPQAGSNTAYYKKTMESTGRCETIYDISPIADYLVKSHPEWDPLPETNEGNGEFIEVLKTKNSANCEGRRNVLTTASNYLSDMGVSVGDLSIVEKQRIVVYGSVNRFIIKSARAAAKLIHSRRNTPLLAAYVNSTLESVEPASERSTQDLPQNLKIVENLNYDFNPKMNEHQAVEPQLGSGGVGAEYRWGTCWVIPTCGNVFDCCRFDFGDEWTATRKVKKCGFLNMGISYECKRE
ncbi:vitellogenin-like [Bradysia coprophila]|uniref:vitellogenin-like n=1 Tax=Bradysia coprophila TaxID=38358 RepID=UPI00187DA5EC|nr:vitellogenin-like [Bradysia coprophila]